MVLGFASAAGSSRTVASRGSAFSGANLTAYSGPVPSTAPAPSRSPLRMVAAPQAETGTVLSPEAIKLLSWVRAHKSIFSPGVGFTATHLALYRKNDTGRCMVPEIELDTNAHMLPGVDIARKMYIERVEVVDKAIADVSAAVPGLADDTAIAKIFFHDIAYFYRVLSYAIAVTSVDYIHANNLGMVKALYADIGLSGKAVTTAIASLRASTLAFTSDPTLSESTAACFDVLSAFMGDK
jgi:Phycobilisome protein